jgi:hypothetical protein
MSNYVLVDYLSVRLTPCTVQDMTKPLGHPENLREILTDPNRLTVTVSEAADILGISRSTAFFAASSSGQLVAGVPVLRIATGSNRERRVVSTAHLRAALGIEADK